MIDVSIIVPIYNTEKYLSKCLNSLVNQNYSKDRYEIYLINDASTDKSLEIIKKYQKKYPNIVLYNSKINHGVSYSRNIGIKNSKGKYLMFCDADDTYDEKAISIFMNIINEQKADFVMADYYIENDKGKFSAGTTNYYQNNQITKKEIISYMSLTSCSKIIKKDLFIKYHLFYDEDVKRCEELSVILPLAYYANNPVVIKDNLYYYYQRKTSASNSNTEKEEKDILYFNITLDRFIKKINSDKYPEEMEFRAIDHLLYGKSLVILKSKMKRKILLKHINDFKKQYPKFIKNSYLKNYRLPKRLFVYCLNYKLIILCKFFAFLHKKVTG